MEYLAQPGGDLKTGKSLACGIALCVALLSSAGVLVHASGPKIFIVWSIVCIPFSVAMVSQVHRLSALWAYPVVRRGAVAAGIVFACTLCVLYVLANRGTIPGGAERDELIIGGLNNLFRGVNPYLFRTAPRAPLSVFPSWLLLNIPFYLAAKLTPQNALFALQNVAALVLGALLLTKTYKITTAQLVLFAALLIPAAPIITHELISGSDYLANSIAVTSMAAAAVSPNEAIAKKPWFLVLLGAILMSRAHFFLVLAPLSGFNLRRDSWKGLIANLSWIVLPAGFLTAAVWVADPHNFMPLHTSNYLGSLNTHAHFDATVRFNLPFIIGLVVVASTACAAAAITWRHPDIPSVLYCSAAVIGIPVLWAFISNSIQHGELYIGPFSSHFLAVAIGTAGAVAVSSTMTDPRHGIAAGASRAQFK